MQKNEVPRVPTRGEQKFGSEEHELRRITDAIAQTLGVLDQPKASPSSTAHPTYRNGSTKNGIKGTGENCV
jgi:hypothetical protein